MSCPILWSVVFDLTFLNEVSKQHVTIKDIHAQVLDSCIAIIVGRPIIRGNYLVRKIPLYFDEIPRSKPDLSQPVEPVKTPVLWAIGDMQLTKCRLNDFSVTDRMITEFTRQCACCQVMSRLHI
jgi:hypothetical protein